MMDATWITAQRTGAATAVAAKYLARDDSSSVAILACGVQGRSNLEALAATYSLTWVDVYDIDQGTADRFAEDMSDRFSIEISVVESPREAVVGADIVVTSGPILRDPQPVIEADRLKPGAFASPVDFDSYWQADALAQANKLATDDRAQMQYYRDPYF